MEDSCGLKTLREKADKDSNHETVLKKMQLQKQNMLFKHLYIKRIGGEREKINETIVKINKMNILMRKM